MFTEAICRRTGVWLSVAIWLVAMAATAWAERQPTDDRFRREIEPILDSYCYGCHGYGTSEGGRTLDDFASDEARLADVELWHAVLKNVQAGLMPPASEQRPDGGERQRLVAWIYADVFRIDPAAPDPGRVTLRRLNRVEYRNTIRDLTGVHYPTDDKFPADDVGYGFDNIGDALSTSPLLMEKYMAAAETIVAEAMEKRPQRFVPRSPTSDRKSDRDDYAREVLRAFATRAFRRPVDNEVVARLAAIAKHVYDAPGQTFEQGIGQAMVAVLASPRFLFRVEASAAGSEGEQYPLVDEYALASRLSYFLWSSMPDQRLLDLVASGKLRENLPTEIGRMLADRRSRNFFENFTGQWLQARDVETIPIDVVVILDRQQQWQTLWKQVRSLRREQAAKDEQEQTERVRQRNEERQRLDAELEKLRKLRNLLGRDIRQAMRRETEMVFEHIAREDRSLLELLDSDYTFLNEQLAKHYGIDGVEGKEMRRVELPAGSPRGGVLTQGTLLLVTSNPTRTSPVKRGQFVLENILGTPAAPPPEAVPPLEASAETIDGRRPTLRETLERHRQDPVCASCHDRMDPLGLALENFDAMGVWRETERGQAIDPSGVLLTGERFAGIADLKKVLETERRLDFYRCVTEKLLTYALGRGLEYYDEPTIEEIVRRVDGEQGRFSVLLGEIVESAAFQRRRAAEPSDDRQARHEPNLVDEETEP